MCPLQFLFEKLLINFMCCKASAGNIIVVKEISYRILQLDACAWLWLNMEV